MVLYAHDDSAIERGVGLAVSAPVEPVALGFAAGGWDWADSAEFGEGSLAADALWVDAGDDEHFGGGVCTDAERGTELRGNLIGELTQ